MNWKLRFYLTVMLFLFSASTLFAEYRAYELEVFDRIANTSTQSDHFFFPVRLYSGKWRTTAYRHNYPGFMDLLWRHILSIKKYVQHLSNQPSFSTGDRVQLVFEKTSD
jgi:hypothetical protein